MTRERNKLAWVRPMVARDPDEPHRAATPLELFFDLVFVVAIAQAASALHHGIAEGHVGYAVLHYTLVFFAVWWAWMGFTWFASAYDNDDVLYRLLVLVQLTGALVLAAGVTRAFEALDYRLVLAGYVLMRVAMITQRLRSAKHDPARRKGALRHAWTLAFLQVCWVVLVFSPKVFLVPGIVLLGSLEMASMAWAEASARTTWHREHILERYGLLTIIVLGETILATALALERIFEAGAFTARMAPIVVGGLLAVYAMWWLYFDRPTHRPGMDVRMGYAWGYGHLVIYASAAAVGAGLAISLDRATGHASIDPVVAGASVAVPAALYVLMLWLLHERPRRGRGHLAFLLTAAALLVTPWSGSPVLAVGLLLAALTAAKLAVQGMPQGVTGLPPGPRVAPEGFPKR